MCETILGLLIFAAFVYAVYRHREKRKAEREARTRSGTPTGSGGTTTKKPTDKQLL